jgi:hypothetical protein
MPTFAIEGQGGSIAFATSVFTSDLIAITLPERSREVIDTTHLGTTGAKTSKPAKLRNIGTIAVEFDHNPAAADLTNADPETITISYPLLAGQTTPVKLQFNGFVISQGGEEFKTDQRMTTKVTIQVNGDVNVIAAT